MSDIHNLPIVPHDLPPYSTWRWRIVRVEVRKGYSWYWKHVCTPTVTRHGGMVGAQLTWAMAMEQAGAHAEECCR
jgi:hypothetical protein